MTSNEEAYKDGYEAYWRDVDENPFSYDYEHDLWSAWCDGHMEAYCQGEGK